MERTSASLAGSDRDAAYLIIGERTGELNYVPGDDKWYVWDGKCHRPDMSGEIGKIVVEWASRYREMLRWAKAQITTLVRRDLEGGDRPPAESAVEREFGQRWAAGGWAAAQKVADRCMNSAGLNALKSYLRDICGMDGKVFEFAGRGFLNCSNGTVNLATGEVRRHNPADMISYCLDIPYVRSKACEARRFWGMVLRVCADSDSAEYLLRVLGYSLLGDNREHLIPVLAGPAGSGKSKVLAIVSEILGPLAHNSQSDLIVHTQHARNARVENSVRGKRLVTLSELSSRLKLDEAQVKRLTGEPVISVNQHYAKMEIDTPVSWLLFLCTNDLPSVANFDGGLRRRFAVIPGGPGLEPWEMIKDIDRQVIAAESEAILALLVNSCIRYFRDAGIPKPLSVEMETEKYIAGQDTVAAFLAECCEKGDQLWEVTASKMWDSYRDWAKGLAYLGRNEFYAKLADHGVRYEPSRRRFTGIRLNLEWSVR